jgi:hypothetical protein
MDGQLLIEEKSIQIDRATNSQPVSTVPKGYAGESPGAAMMEFTVEEAVPQGGFDFDAGKKMAALQPAHLYVIGPAGLQLKGEVFVISDSLKHGVNQEANYSFRARGSFALWS